MLAYDTWKEFFQCMAWKCHFMSGWSQWRYNRGSLFTPSLFKGARSCCIFLVYLADCHFSTCECCDSPNCASCILSREEITISLIYSGNTFHFTFSSAHESFCQISHTSSSFTNICIFLQLRQEKVQLEHTLEQEQECLVNKLMRRIEKLETETTSKQTSLDNLRREKVELENTLEQEQEALVNKLWKRMDQLETEKR